MSTAPPQTEGPPAESCKTLKKGKLSGTKQKGAKQPPEASPTGQPQCDDAQQQFGVPLEHYQDPYNTERSNAEQLAQDYSGGPLQAPVHQTKPQKVPKTIDLSVPRSSTEEEEVDLSAVPCLPSPMPPSVNVLILVTGSVAAIKLGLLLDQFEGERCSIRIAVTKSAFYFIHRAQASKNPIPFQSLVTDDDEWRQWEVVSDAVVHVELRRWADVVLIAPLDANTLAKISGGVCDNLVTCVMRAWEVQCKPVIVCPAMNTAMWTHPITQQQLQTLQKWFTTPEHQQPFPEDCFSPNARSTTTLSGSTAALTGAPPSLPENLEAAMFQVVWPIKKRLACGDIGIGGMASVESIAEVIRHTMQLIRNQKLNDIMPV